MVMGVNRIWWAVACVGFVLLASVATAGAAGLEHCATLKRALATTNTTKRPIFSQDLARWPDLLRKSANLEVATETKLDNAKTFSSRLSRYGAITTEAAKRLKEFTKFADRYYIYLHEFSSDRHIVALSYVAGTAYCQRILLLRQRKDGAWDVLPPLDADTSEGAFCLHNYGERVSLARIGGKTVAVLRDFQKKQTSFGVFPLAPENRRDGRIERACVLRADFRSGYKPVIVDYTEGDDETCKSSLCRFIAGQADVIGRNFEFGRSQFFTLPISRSRFIDASVRSAAPTAIHKLKVENVVWWSLSDGTKLFYAITTPKFGERAFRIGIVSQRNGKPAVSPLRARYQDYHEVKQGTGYDLAVSGSRLEPFVFEKKTYLSHFGYGTFGWRVYPGYLLLVYELDGTKLVLRLRGSLDDHFAGSPKFTLSTATR